MPAGQCTQEEMEEVEACQHVARAAAAVVAMLAGTHPHEALPMAPTVHAILEAALHDLQVRMGWGVC